MDNERPSRLPSQPLMRGGVRRWNALRERQWQVSSVKCLHFESSWRPGRIGIVSSVGWRHFRQLLCGVREELGLWLRAQTRSSSCLAAGVQSDGVVELVGGTVQAALAPEVKYIVPVPAVASALLLLAKFLQRHNAGLALYRTRQ